MTSLPMVLAMLSSGQEERVYHLCAVYVRVIGGMTGRVDFAVCRLFQ